MKKYLKNSLLTFIVFSLLLSGVSVEAKKTNKKLYNQYNYQENFVYGDEIIAHALKSSVVKIELYFSAELEYEPVIFNSELMEERFSDVYNEFSDEYNEDEIIEAFLTNVQENIEDYLEYAPEKEISTTGAWAGSGVVIGEDGYIATNAHVAALDENSKAQLYLESLREGVGEDLEIVIEEIEECGMTLTESQIELLYSYALEEAASKVKILEEEGTLVVRFPSASGETNLSSATKYEAEIVEVGSQDGVDGLTQDTAILKIDAENLVALKLSDTYPEFNSKIVSAGFPGASDEIFQLGGSSESVMSVTVGTGEVARIVPIEDMEYKAIEITSNISNGNSGGPSVDAGLNIEGLNTYGLPDDKRYAYMISAEFVRELSNDLDIGQGEVSKTFLLGLQMMQQNYGKTALECFEKVKELQPDTPYIEHLIQCAEALPAEEGPANENPEVAEEPTEDEDKATKKKAKKSKKADEEQKEKLKSKVMPSLIWGGSSAALWLIIIVIVSAVTKKKKY